MDLPPSLRGAAWLQIAFGSIGIAGIGLVATLFGRSTHGYGANTDDPPYLMLAIALLAPAVVAGVLVLRRHPQALLALSMVARLQLLIVPVGTALGAFSLWAVRRATAEPADDEEPNAPPPMELLPDVDRTAPLLAMVAAVGVGFAVVIGLGFWISGDTLPADADEALMVALVVLTTILAIAFEGMRRRRRLRAGARPH